MCLLPSYGEEHKHARLTDSKVMRSGCNSLTNLWSVNDIQDFRNKSMYLIILDRMRKRRKKRRWSRKRKKKKHEAGE